MSKPAPIIALCVLLVVVLAAVLLRFFAKRRASSKAGGRRAPAEPKAGGSELPFPWRAPFLPSPSEMFYNLANSKIRRRKEPGFTRVVMRNEMDLQKSDRIADHYSEGARALSSLPGRESLWGLWRLPAVRDRALRLAKRELRRGSAPDAAAPEREGAPLVLALRTMLGASDGEPPDTNPAFVKYLIERLAKDMKADVSELRIVDVAVGWGGQLFGACAADVGAYQAYVPFVDKGSKKLAAELSTALQVHRPEGASSANFWVRQMEVGQAGPQSVYDIAFFATADLTSIDGGVDSPLCRSVKNGGCVVMFVPPGKRNSARALAAVEMMVQGGMGLPAMTFGVRFPKSVLAAPSASARSRIVESHDLAKALVWKID